MNRLARLDPIGGGFVFETMIQRLAEQEWTETSLQVFAKQPVGKTW